MMMMGGCECEVLCPVSFLETFKTGKGIGNRIESRGGVWLRQSQKNRKVRNGQKTSRQQTETR
jgi:hypothetical protein